MRPMLAAVLLLGALPEMAVGADPTCEITGSVNGGPANDVSLTVRVGEELTITGTDFIPETTVIIGFSLDGFSPAEMFETTSDSIGGFVETFVFEGNLQGDEREYWLVSAGHSGSVCGDFLNLWVTAATPFLDIAENPFAGDIAWIYQNSITLGCAPSLFCPTEAVTREQMASFLARAKGLPDPVGDYFVDDNGSPHEADINRVYEAGIAFGCGPYLFCPAQTITREQMASFLARARGLGTPIGDYFVDDAGSPHEADINRVREAGIAFGCGAFVYCPSAPVTREQMAAFLHRAFGS